MDGLASDIRLAARRLLKAPAFTLIAAGTLALGSGVNTAIFSVVIVNETLARRYYGYPGRDPLALLYDVPATDVVTFAGTAAVLVAVALLASWLPARKAGRVDPVLVLREE